MLKCPRGIDRYRFTHFLAMMVGRLSIGLMATSQGSQPGGSSRSQGSPQRTMVRPLLPIKVAGGLQLWPRSTTLGFRGGPLTSLQKLKIASFHCLHGRLPFTLALVLDFGCLEELPELLAVGHFPWGGFFA